MPSNSQPHSKPCACAKAALCNVLTNPVRPTGQTKKMKTTAQHEPRHINKYIATIHTCHSAPAAERQLPEKRGPAGCAPVYMISSYRRQSARAVLQNGDHEMAKRAHASKLQIYSTNIPTRGGCVWARLQFTCATNFLSSVLRSAVR